MGAPPRTFLHQSLLVSGVQWCMAVVLPRQAGAKDDLGLEIQDQSGQHMEALYPKMKDLGAGGQEVVPFVDFKSPEITTHTLTCFVLSTLFWGQLGHNYSVEVQVVSFHPALRASSCAIKSPRH